MTFVERESYIHKKAKEVVKEWFDTFTDDYTDFPPFHFKSSGIYLEYPIMRDGWEHYQYDLLNADGRVLNCEQFVSKFTEYPLAIIDVVCMHKGFPIYGIEICHTNPVSKEKIKKLEKVGVTNLYEVDALWVLQQTSVPSEMKCKQFL